MKNIIILDLVVNLDSIERKREAADYAIKRFKDLAFRLTKKICLGDNDEIYLLVSDFSKIYLVKIEQCKKPTGKEKIENFEIEMIRWNLRKSDIKQIVDGFIIAYVDSFDGSYFDFIKND